MLYVVYEISEAINRISRYEASHMILRSEMISLSLYPLFHLSNARNYKRGSGHVRTMKLQEMWMASAYYGAKVISAYVPDDVHYDVCADVRALSPVEK
jgi:hypothetical protein